MSLQGRLDALARKAREAGYFTGAEPCRSCGWPRRGAPPFVVVNVERDREPPTCATCGHHVDDAGNALGGARTTIVLYGIRLELSGGTSVSLTTVRSGKSDS